MEKDPVFFWLTVYIFFSQIDNLFLTTIIKSQIMFYLLFYLH